MSKLKSEGKEKKEYIEALHLWYGRDKERVLRMNSCCLSVILQTNRGTRFGIHFRDDNLNSTKIIR